MDFGTISAKRSSSSSEMPHAFFSWILKNSRITAEPLVSQPKTFFFVRGRVKVGLWSIIEMPTHLFSSLRMSPPSGFRFLVSFQHLCPVWMKLKNHKHAKKPVAVGKIETFQSYKVSNEWGLRKKAVVTNVRTSNTLPTSCSHTWFN